jgi:enoyl-[acyl-carrier protein] reductase I
VGILDGKRLLITGVITDASIAFSVARVAQEQGAQVVLTGYGRMSLVERVARKLPKPAPLVEMDVTDPEHLARLPELVGAHVDGIDGVMHSIAFAPPSCLGGDFLDAPWEDVATALHVSAFSLKSPGRRTTGWAWPRPGSNRRPATWLASWAPGESG